MDVTTGHHTGVIIAYTADGQAVQLFLPLSLVYTEAGYDIFRAAVRVTVYADAGTDIVLDQYSPDGATGTAFLTVSGYLSDV